jgi:hypothetical protein
MLDLAINHEEELKYQFRQTWFQDKYKYYNYFTYFEDVEIDKSSWNRHQFVSLNKEGKIVGYMAYNVRRAEHICDCLNIINFTDNIALFGNDLKRVLTDIFEKFKFNKLKFSVVVGNPIEKSYDEIVEKYGGRIVGVEEKEAKLFDGEYYDVKLYEITRSSYEIMRGLNKPPILYNCEKEVIYPPKNFIEYNCADGYKESVCVDKCIAKEIEELWRQGVKTTGCCCGHGSKLGFIQVRDKVSVEKMKQLGYQHYIYEEKFGGKERLDAFIPKTTKHFYEGYSEGYVG